MMEESREKLLTSMTTSGGFSDSNNITMDEDVLNYLSTLTANQQKQLDDFVSINDHSIIMPMPSDMTTIKFAYGNSVGANHYFGRPLSVYEPFVPEEPEFSSLPPDLVSNNDHYHRNAPFGVNGMIQKYSWEAEDTEYIETLNEVHDNYEYQSLSNYAAPEHHYEIPSPCTTIVVAADVHDNNNSNITTEPVPSNDHIYATVQKPKKHSNQIMITSNMSDPPPCEKFPKIMTQSCYGDLPADLHWNCYEQDLVQSMENIIEDEISSQHHQQQQHQQQQYMISSLLTTTTDSSIIDGISSLNSSIYEQIPSMTSSIEAAATRTTINGQRKIVKWWDDHRHLEESATADMHGMAEEGKHRLSN